MPLSFTLQYGGRGLGDAEFQHVILSGVNENLNADFNFCYVCFNFTFILLKSFFQMSLKISISYFPIVPYNWRKVECYVLEARAAVA